MFNDVNINEKTCRLCPVNVKNVLMSSVLFDRQVLVQLIENRENYELVNKIITNSNLICYFERLMSDKKDQR